MRSAAAIKALGGEIPRDLSLLAFDNMPESALFPFSTIDWGFSRLGYLAAHIFVGDIPIHADRDGAIPGICTLIDRGSVAPPPAVVDYSWME
jgi:DNA-binding LacI/PurR family transcriptional regulator